MGVKLHVSIDLDEVNLDHYPDNVTTQREAIDFDVQQFEDQKLGLEELIEMAGTVEVWAEDDE